MGLDPEGDVMSTVLDVFYVSDYRVAPINTLEITCDGLDSIFICDGFKDRTLTLEDARIVTFQASGVDVSLPEKSNSGGQTLGFAIDNVYGQAQQFITDAITAQKRVQVTYRMFLSDDPTAPADVPLTMDVISADIDNRTVQVQAAPFDLLNANWPRDRYTADKYPGITYL